MSLQSLMYWSYPQCYSDILHYIVLYNKSTSMRKRM